MLHTTSNIMFAIGFALWGLLWWWARGGRFGYWCRHGKPKDEVPNLWFLFQFPIAALRFGFEPGTQATRAVTMLMFVLPLVFIDWRLIALWPAQWFAVACLGWGSYMDMGDEDRPDNERTRALLKWFGLLDGTTWYDLVGMTVTGLLRGSLMWSAFVMLGYEAAAFMFLMALMGPIYWAAWRIKDRLSRDYTEVAEMATGVIVALCQAGVIFHAV